MAASLTRQGLDTTRCPARQGSGSKTHLPFQESLRVSGHHRLDGTTLSRFDYTYDIVGNITTWRQQADTNTPNEYTLTYDAADQLTAADLRNVATQAFVKRYVYAYDQAGNRTSEQIDDAVLGATYNTLNQLISQQASGALRFKGMLDKPARVSVQGQAASVSATNTFEAQVPVRSGESGHDHREGLQQQPEHRRVSGGRERDRSHVQLRPQRESDRRRHADIRVGC